MKIWVVCAVIINDLEQILVSLPKKDTSAWEFAGGKIEENESAEAALHREIKEELGVEIRILRVLPNASSNHKGRNIHLIPFMAEIIQGEPLCIDHVEHRWCSPEELKMLPFSEADKSICAYLLNAFETE